MERLPGVQTVHGSLAGEIDGRGAVCLAPGPENLRQNRFFDRILRFGIAFRDYERQMNGRFCARSSWNLLGLLYASESGGEQQDSKEFTLWASSSPP